MKDSFESEFDGLSDRCRQHIRTGQINLYSSDLKEMAALLEREGRFLDVLRILIPAFYIDLSGFAKAPCVDKGLLSMLWAVVSNSEIDMQQLDELYLEMIRPDMMPKHCMSVAESLYIFHLCLDKKVEQAEYILSKI